VCDWPPFTEEQRNNIAAIFRAHAPVKRRPVRAARSA
jgi:hypothetical protein